MSMALQIAQQVDAKGLSCPMPIVKTAKAMKELGAGGVLKLLATDRGATTDVPAWTDTPGNEALEWHEEDGTFVFLIRKVA